MDNISSSNLNFTLKRLDDNTLIVKHNNRETKILQSVLEAETAVTIDATLRELQLDPTNEYFSALTNAIQEFFEEEKQKHLKLVKNGNVIICEANKTKVSVSWLPKKPHKVVEEIEKRFKKAGATLSKEQSKQLNESIAELAANFAQTKESKGEKKVQKFKEAGHYRNLFFESIYVDGIAKFLVYDAEKDEFEIVDKLETETEIYLPTPKDQIPYEPYEFVEDETPAKEELYKEIYSIVDDYLVIPTEWKHLLTAFVLLSYEQAKVSTVPYFGFVGDNESGKSTDLEVLKRLSYRPLNGTTIPAADMFGYLSDEEIAKIFEKQEDYGTGEKTRYHIRKLREGFESGNYKPFKTENLLKILEEVDEE